MARQSVVSPFKDGLYTLLKAGGFPPIEISFLVTSALDPTLRCSPSVGALNGTESAGKASTKELLSRHLPNRAASEE